MCCSSEWKRWMLLLYCGDLTMDEAMVYVQTQIKDGNAKSDVAKVIMKLCQRTGRAGAWNPHIPWPSTVDHNHAMHGAYKQRMTDRSLVDWITVSVIDTGPGNSRRNQDDTQHCKRHKLMTSECLGLYHGREDDTRVSHGDGGCGAMLIHKQIGCCCNGVTFNRMGRPLFHALTDE